MFKSVIRLELSSGRTGQNVITLTDTDTAFYNFFFMQNQHHWIEWSEMQHLLFKQYLILFHIHFTAFQNDNLDMK